MIQECRHAIFVYGSLRAGGHNDIRYLFSPAYWLRNGWIIGRLYNLGAYPGVILDPKASRVYGEIYSVDSQTLAHLDQFESVNETDPEQSHYWRRQVTTYHNNGESTLAWVYECNPAVWQLNHLISTGDWMQR